MTATTEPSERAIEAAMQAFGTLDARGDAARIRMRYAIRAAYDTDETIAALRRRVEVLTKGYAGAFYATPSPGSQPQIHLYYESHEQADAAMESWCELIDAALRQAETKGGR